jgi:hypothetical protein
MFRGVDVRVNGRPAAIVLDRSIAGRDTAYYARRELVENFVVVTCRGRALPDGALVTVDGHPFHIQGVAECLRA